MTTCTCLSNLYYIFKRKWNQLIRWARNKREVETIDDRSTTELLNQCHQCKDMETTSIVIVDECKRSISYTPPGRDEMNRVVKPFGINYEFRNFTIVKCARGLNNGGRIILCSDCIKVMLDILEDESNTNQ